MAWGVAWAWRGAQRGAWHEAWGVGRGAWGVVWGPEISMTRKQPKSDSGGKDAGAGIILSRRSLGQSRLNALSEVGGTREKPKRRKTRSELILDRVPTPHRERKLFRRKVRNNPSGSELVASISSSSR